MKAVNAPGATDNSVTDWATDFDCLDPDWVENACPIWDALRSKRPIAHTDRPTRYADVRSIAGHGTLLIAPAHSTGWTASGAARTTHYVRSTGTSGAKKCSATVFFTAEAIARYEPRTPAKCRESKKGSLPNLN
jgi:hypothetical protein